MRCKAKLCACALCILVSVLVPPLIVVTQVSPTSQLAAAAVRAEPEETASRATPSAADDIWGPEVGAPAGEESTRLPALAISEDQIAANSTIVSDDFNGCTLDTNVWTFVDPVGDCSYDMVGAFTDDAWLSISVPVSVSHDLYKDGNFAPRVMQDASDVNFEIEAKFESGLSEHYQMQGLLVEQAIDHYLRFEFYSDGSSTKLYVASFEPDPSPPPPMTYTVYYHQPITETNVAPLYMRVRREVNQWTPYYSYNGVDWVSPVSFPYTFTVTKVGAYAANHATPEEATPAHTGYIDYFFNTASPIDPEDGERNTLTVNVVGSGSVDIDPVKSNYDCGDVVTLTANPDSGWNFVGWTGDLTGTENPATIAMDGSKTVVASFVHSTFVPLVSKTFTNYLFVGDFETGDLTGFYWQNNQPDVVSVNTPVELGPGPPHPVRDGVYSMRSYLHRDNSEHPHKTMVHLSSDDSNPPNTHSTFRFELGEEYWIGFSVYVQDGFVIDKPDVGELVFQVQASPDPDEAYRSPILAMEIDEDDWRIVSRWDTRPTTPDETFTGSATVYQKPLGSSIGSWTDWVFHIKWTHQSDGFIEVWRDGKLVGSRTGPNGSNDQEGPYPSFGIYKWPWKPGNESSYPSSNTDWRLFYHDEIRIAGADGDYGVVAPGLPLRKTWQRALPTPLED